ncbi:MAG: histidinol dehydrogenase, partial [Sphingomonadales bacterium]
RQVFGTVGIDMIAGPSEVLIIADSSANPAWVAADLVDDEVLRQLETLPRAEIARDGWEEFGALITVASMAEAVELANRIASEHVELAIDDPQSLLPRIRNAGAIFLGHHTPEAIGDYVGGTNHVLPTARSARFASGLGVLDFMKRTSILGCDPSSLAELSKAAVTLAATEGLDAHGRSVSIRLNR